eukprot:1702477-Prymnesium_polylepis.1
MSASAQQLNILGLGSCGDDRSGTTRLLGSNLSKINRAIRSKEVAAAPLYPIVINGTSERIKLRIRVVLDVAAIRHTEHLINSGLCGCSRDKALRSNPIEIPLDVAAMRAMLNNCKSLSCAERFSLSHSCHPCDDCESFEEEPRPCPAPGCTFAHDAAMRKSELTALLAQEAQLAADLTSKGKRQFSEWRLAHAKTHFNVPPGHYGRPMLYHHLDDQILDSLHLAELNLPKLPHKYGLLNN